MQSRLAVAVLFVALSLCRIETASAITGNDWMKLNKDNQLAYVIGVFDTWTTEVSACQNSTPNPICEHVKTVYETIMSCLKQRSYSRLTAIVENYIRDHPEELEYSMAGHVLVALNESCQNTKP